MGYKLPSTPSTLTGKTRASVTAYKEVSSKYGPQIEFEFTTEKGTRFRAWMTITSLNQVLKFLEAGILRKIAEDEFEPVPIGLQPKLTVTLNKGRVEKFEQI